MWILVLMMLARTPASRTAFYADSFARRPSVAELTALGRAAFADPSLSESGTLACASCHDPARAFSSDSLRKGMRAVPSLRYQQGTPAFTEHALDPETGIDQGPTGGFAWDGRAASLHEQALAPLLSPLEMANASQDAIAGRLRHAPYAAKMRAMFGDDVLDHTASAVKALTLALEVYQQDPVFYPYASTYDDVLRGRATLSAREARGKALFDDPAKGNCASCHPDTMEHGFPVFTDRGFVALGVPRVPGLPIDRGLCGPLRTDLQGKPELCDRFKTPTLRNVGKRHRFMHDGVFTSLTQVVEFYAGRIPRTPSPNLEQGAPFTSHLTDSEIADIVAFLYTLDDR